MQNTLLKVVLESYKDCIFIPENTPSGKNNRICAGKFLIDAPAVKAYKGITAPIWSNTEIKAAFKKMLPKTKPYFIGFHFIKSTKHKFDFINPLQTVQDLMVKYEWIEDDNTTIMFPVPLSINGEYFSIDKTNPGVIIKPIKNYEKNH
jgi:hypothetical protein